MNYYVWDKKSKLLGISAEAILETRPDFRNDDVIVISNEEEHIITVETKTYFKELYDINSDDVDIVALATIHEMRKENVKTIEESLKELDEQRDPEATFKTYLQILEELMEDDRQEQEYNAYMESKKDNYEDPDVKVISLDDISEDVKIKKLNIVFSHVFVAEDREGIPNLQCMYKYRKTMEELQLKMNKAEMEGDESTYNMACKEIALLNADIEDECNATIKVDATALYDYGDALIIHCDNGQNMIVDNSIVDSLRESAIEYERRGEDNEKYKVHYKTVNITLSAWYNELNERGNTVFITDVK